MKKLLILTLFTLWAFIDIKAQSNYFITSVADVEITETGSGLLSSQFLKDTSEVVTSQRFWFLSPKGFDPASSKWYQFGDLNVVLKNLSSSQWKKVTLYDFTGTTIIYTANIAPSATLYLDFNNNRRLDASKDYYWKFENVSSQNVVCNNDTKTVTSLNLSYIDVLDNDLNLPAGTDCRLKAGQILAGGLMVIKDQFTGLKVTTSSQQGSFSFIYEAVNNGTVLGEATATITVGASTQYCTLAILDEKLQEGSQTVHEFTLYSPNAQINPFNYEVRTGSYTGTIVKSGTTPPADNNKEIIDFTGLATGTYYVTFSSTVSTCFDMQTVTHVAVNDACNASIISVDKVNGTNNYTVNSSFSNVSTIKAYLTDAEFSIGSPLLIQTGITTPTFNLNISTLPTRSYFLVIEGEGKYCKAQKSFEHTLIVITGGGSTGTGKLETWTKFIHNYKDNIIISGKNDYESGRDKFGLQTYAENANNVVWKAFISDFENLGNSNRAKSIIGFRKDTARNEVGISVAITPTSLILQQRSTKSEAMATLATVSGITAPVWIRLVKTGNNLVADYSKDLTNTPVWQELGRVNNVFNGFNKYQKYLGVASAKTDVIASARFQGFLGGNVNFDSPNVTINPPLIACNVLSPSSGQSVTLSTSTACIAPNTNKWYKNTDNVSFSAGSTVNVQAYNTDSYYARCENGLNKSVKSNVVTFTISNLLSCNNGTNPFAVASAVYASGNITFTFNASGLTNANWSVLNGSTITKTGTIQPTASTQTIAVSSLSAGNYIFKIDGVSCLGTAQRILVVQDATVAPTLSSVPQSVKQGDNLTLTASGCVGNYTFFKNTESTPFTTTSGSTSLINVQAPDYYYVRCSSGSLNSNYIEVMANMPSSTGVTITEPNKPQYFFSNNQAPSFYNNLNNLPAIFTNQSGYDAINDLVWLRNDKIKIAINLKRGGQIAWASLINDTQNLIYNGFDGGFQVQLDAYQKRDGYTQNGKVSRAQYDQINQFNSNVPPNNLTSYNTTQGGDFLNHSQSLIDYQKIGQNSYYIKIRPIFYTIDREFSRTYIEATYTLDGYALKCDYTYTSYRNDDQYDGGGFDGGHAPICFLVNNLTRYKSYTGNTPFTRSNRYDVEDGVIPNEQLNQPTSGTPLTKNSKERWSLVYNPNNNKTIGVYANTSDVENSFSIKQKEVYQENGPQVGNEFTGGYTVLGRNYDLVPLLTNFDRTNFTKSVSSYLIVTPDTNTFIDKVYQIAGY